MPTPRLAAAMAAAQSALRRLDAARTIIAAAQHAAKPSRPGARGSAAATPLIKIEVNFNR